MRLYPPPARCCRGCVRKALAKGQHAAGQDRRGGLGVASRKGQEKRLRPSLRGTASSSLAISASCSLQRRSVTPRRLKRTQGHAGTRGPARSHPAIDARRRIAEALWSHDSSYMRRSGDAARFRLLLPRRTRGGRCVSASTHASTSRMDWMGCCCRISRRISCAHSGRPGSPGESVLGAAWQRQFNDPFPKRRCHEQTERGGCIPRVAVWVSLDTVLDAFLVRASPADAKPIASRGLYRPISDRAAPPALASGRGALEMGWRWGWNLPCWGPCSPDGQQAAAGVGVCQWRARTGSRVFRLRQDASGECKGGTGQRQSFAAREPVSP